MSPSPTPEPQPELPTSTKRRSDILEQRRVDLTTLATAFSRTPTPDPLPESSLPHTHPVLDINASAATGSLRPLPAERPPSASFHETLAGRSLDHQRASALAIPASPRSSTYPESLSTMPPASGLQALAIAATFARLSSLPRSEDWYFTSDHQTTPSERRSSSPIALAPVSHTRNERYQAGRSPDPGAGLALRQGGALLEPISNVRDALQCFDQVMVYTSTENLNLLPTCRDHLSVVRRALVSEVAKTATG